MVKIVADLKLSYRECTFCSMKSNYIQQFLKIKSSNDLYTAGNSGSQDEFCSFLERK